MSEILSFQPESTDDQTPRIGMAPLVDIVLLLICFYLLVMQSMQARTDDAIQLPTMANLSTVEPIPAELVLNISAEEVLNLNGADIDPGALVGLLEQERLRAAQAGQELNVVVRADARQRYRMLATALDACREAGMGVVTIRVTQGPSQ